MAARRRAFGTILASAGTSQIAAVLLAAVMFEVVTVWRFAVDDPVAAIGFLYTVPIALLAVTFGFRGGIVGAAVAVALTALCGETQHGGIGATSYFARTLAFTAVALVIAWQVERRNSFKREANRWISLSTDLLCVANFDGYFIRVNPWWREHLGYEEGDLLCKPYLEFVHPDDVERTAAEAAALASGPHVTVDFENRYRARDGSWHWLQWSARSDGALIYGAARDVTERKVLEEKLAALALEDALTGVGNRHAWEERVSEELERASRLDLPLCLAMIDLDHLKRVNDERGHAAGDELLRRCAEAWRASVRMVDFLARVGGDEFSLLLPNCSLEDALGVIARMRDSKPDASFSVGIARWAPPESAVALVREPIRPFTPRRRRDGMRKRWP
jgi:diguanylate cyclase (GGDEF)-like protein/PAS domain S-box-containing protein